MVVCGFTFLKFDRLSEIQVLDILALVLHAIMSAMPKQNLKPILQHHKNLSLVYYIHHSATPLSTSTNA